MVKKKKSTLNIWMFFWTFLILMLVLNFVGHEFGITNSYWHFFLHIGIVIFSFLILIYSLKLNDKAMKFIIFGSILLIITNCVLFMARVFIEYIWLETNLFTFLGMVIGVFFVMIGFKEAVN